MMKNYVGHLDGVLVNLNGLGILTAELYHDGCVYGMLHYNGQDEAVIIDLETGLVRRLTRKDDLHQFAQGDDPKFLVQRLTKILHPEVVPTVIQNDVLRKLISTLLAHRVSGEKIVQGLKLDGINIQPKLIENYLGGWNVSLTSETKDGIPGITINVSVADLIEKVCILLERKE